MVAVIIAAAGFYFFSLSRETGIEINNASIVDNKSDLPTSPLSGQPCVNANRRPIAVMLASDYIARPLSGIGEADLVIELPVITGTMTRLMALFVCSDAEEIGSVRSARHDFIPLAKGWDAIYAHWGGSYLALDQLSLGAIDNLDALPNPDNAFYRVSSKPAPHNGFTNLSRLVGASEKLGYRLQNNFSGYQFSSFPSGGKSGALIIDYPGRLRLEYRYDNETGFYERFRGGEAEIDKNSGLTVKVKNVVVMRVMSRQIDGQYNDLDLGGGEAEIFRAGEAVGGRWKKGSDNNPLKFYNNDGQEIDFVPGPIWIEGVEEEVKVEFLISND